MAFKCKHFDGHGYCFKFKKPIIKAECENGCDMSEKIERKEVVYEKFYNALDIPYEMPMCPTCNEPTYSMDTCPFCGQPFKMAPCGKGYSCEGCEDYPCFTHFGPQEG